MCTCLQVLTEARETLDPLEQGLQEVVRVPHEIIYSVTDRHGAQKQDPLTSHLGGTGADAGVCMHSGYPKNSMPPSLAEYLSRNKIRP